MSLPDESRSAAETSNLQPVNQAFTLFPQFPIELRSKIWTHSFEEDRLIELDLTIIPTEVPYGQKRDYTIYLSHLMQPPAALSVHRESRQHALKEFQTLFDTIGFIKPLYYHPEKDIVSFTLCGRFLWRDNYADPYLDLRDMTGKDMDAIRRLAVYNCTWWRGAYGNNTSVTNWGVGGHSMSGQYDLQLQYFTKLEELIFVSGNDADAELLGIIKADDVEDCQSDIANFLLNEQIKCPDYMVPRITVISNEALPSFQEAKERTRPYLTLESRVPADYYVTDTGGDSSDDSDEVDDEEDEDSTDDSDNDSESDSE